MSLLIVSLLIILVPILALTLGFNFLQSQKGKSKNDNSQYVRKYDSADLRKYRTMFLSFGLLISFGVSSYIYNYEFPDDPEVAALQDPVNTDEEVYDELPNTDPKPPAKPKQIIQPPPVEVPPEVVPEEQPEDEPPPEEQPDDPIPDDMFGGDEGGGEGTPEPVNDEVFFYAEVMPEFPGGMNALAKKVSDNLNGLLSSRDRERIENLPRNSLVYVSYVIEKDGSITNVKIERGLPIAGLDEKVLESLKDLPKWAPASTNGYKVRLHFTQKIKIK